MRRAPYLYSESNYIINKIIIMLITFCVEDLKIDLYTLLNNVSISTCSIHQEIKINDNESFNFDYNWLY